MAAQENPIPALEKAVAIGEQPCYVIHLNYGPQVMTMVVEGEREQLPVDMTTRRRFTLAPIDPATGGYDRLYIGERATVDVNMQHFVFASRFDGIAPNPNA